MPHFWAKVDIGDPDHCWKWSGCLDRDGYGIGSVRGRSVRVHVYVYKSCIGGIPDGYDVHHTCGTRSCCNPRHLKAESKVDHLNEPGHAGAIHAAVTHCPRGHEYTEDNTRMYRGSRNCRQCDKERQRRRRSSVAAA